MCINCGKPSYRKMSGTNKAKGHKNKYCCMACRVEYADKARKESAVPLFSYVYAAMCKGCGKPYVSKKKKDYCCDACRPSAASSVESRAKLASRPCATCGKPCGYTFGRAKIYCSKECARKSEANKEARRASKARRRKIIKTAFVETVKPFKVFDRDKWRCQLCGCKTPKNRRNTIYDNAPELDHIIPLSKGGDHSYLNTQCACRRCNGLKSNHPRGQMLMFG